jgi:hypothetical protein
VSGRGISDQSGARALRNGALEICISPANGWLSSRIRKIAPEADNAKTNRAAIAVGLSRENRLKLAKDDGEPEHQHRQKRCGDRAARLHKQHQARLREIVADFNRPCLEQALDFVADRPTRRLIRPGAAELPQLVDCSFPASEVCTQP